MEFLVFKFVPITSSFHWEEPGSVFFPPLIKDLYTWWDHPELPLLQAESQLSQASLACQILQSLNHLRCLSLAFLQCVHVCQHWAWPFKCFPRGLRKEEGSPPSICWQCYLLCWLIFSCFFVYQGSSFFATVFQPVNHGMYWCLELFFPRCRTLHFAWLNIMRFLWAHFSCLLRSFFEYFLVLLILEFIQKDIGMRVLALVSWAIKCRALFCSVSMLLCSFWQKCRLSTGV